MDSPHPYRSLSGEHAAPRTPEELRILVLAPTSNDARLTARFLEQAGLILRQRVEDDRPEFTLKYRSPDRYLASSTNMSAGEGLQANEKFEEDIAAPFRSRMSYTPAAIAVGVPIVCVPIVPSALAR